MSISAGVASFEEELNAEQLAAVRAGDGPVLVLAAAGTGKTRTLVYRVAHLVQSGVAPERIVLLTFTNRAAKEMIERARTVVGEHVGGIWGGTFHHFSNKILRRHASLLGYNSRFAIMDRDDAKSLIGECVKALNFDGADFPKPSVLVSVFSEAVNKAQPLEALCVNRFPEPAPDPEEVVMVRDLYEKRKREMGAMDFDDLVVNCLLLFREHPELAARYQEHFLHVLVDEYQDTNIIQAELVDRLAARHRNLLVVGDDFQCIYSWRGADFRNILSFPTRYADAQVYKLETNYRSVPEILQVANACIAGNPDQFQKTLKATRSAHIKPHVAMLRDGDEQARYVVDQVRRLRREGYKLSDMAVLYRAHFHALELERMLPQQRLEYVITSGVRFFEQQHVKDVCSLLRLTVHPEDELAFNRFLGLLPGVGPKTVNKLWADLGRSFNPCDAEQRRRLGGKLRPGAKAAWAQIEPVFPAGGGSSGVSAGDIVRGFVDAFYEHYLVNNFEDAEYRLDDLGALAGDLSGYATLEDFLSEMALMSNVDAEGDRTRKDGGDALRLSTVHQAKGLEFAVVFILWASDGMFPSAKAMAAESFTGEAEERRLFYVAVTRAKDELFLCVPEIRRMRDGGAMPCPPSRFVKEIPQKYVREEYVSLF